MASTTPLTRTYPGLLTRTARVVAIALLTGQAVAPAAAHNNEVHKGMAERAVFVMRLANRQLITNTMGPPPAGATAQQWGDFHKAMLLALTRLDTVAGNPAEGLGPALGEAATKPDYNLDDTHLFIKLTNAGGAGFGNKLADEVQEHGLAVALVPVICIGSCLASFFGFGDDLCEECVKNAKDIADKVPTATDIKNLIPGVGDFTSEAFTGLWHFINMAPGAALSNDFDDHQGMLYEEAGPFRVPGGIDIAIMAATDIAGLSINPDLSDGVKHYEIAPTNDAFPDGDSYDGSAVRGGLEWQKYPMGHTPFSPVDNLGLFGWRQYLSGAKTIANLGYPLHALGDATVPMHVTGTTGWGHRPFEDAHSHLWLDGKIQAALDEDRVKRLAFAYYRQIKAWQAAGHPGDIPVRGLVRAVARKTHGYAMSKSATTFAADPARPWPFNDQMSTLWHTVSEDQANAYYRDRADAVALGVPLIEDGIAAQLAFLVAAGEPAGITERASPAGFRLAAFNASDADRALFRDREARAQRPGKAPPAPASLAQEQFTAAVRMGFARLAQQLLLGKLSPGHYLGRVRDRSAKAKRMLGNPRDLAAFAAGDRDDDLVPDSRDRQPDTPALARTDADGVARSDLRPEGRPREPGVPSQRDLAALFARMNMVVPAACANQEAPSAPRLIRLGYSTPDRDLLFGTGRVPGATAACPVFYEVGVRLHAVFPGNASFLPADTYRTVVFRHDQNDDRGAPGQDRMIFRIARAGAQSGDRDFLLQHVSRYGKVEWRVRAINASGMSSPWSGFVQGAEPISFGEP